MVKTGTTSIQGFLSLNRDALKAAGWTLPKSPGLPNQTRLAAYARSPSNWNDDLFVARGINDLDKLEQFRVAFASDLRAEIAASNTENYIMSSEHCSGRLRTIGEVQMLHDLLYSMFDNIRILLYVRRQDDFVTSIYATSVRVGNVKKFTSANIRWQSGCDFQHLLQPWISVFGEQSIILRLFDKRAMRNEDLVNDLCGVLNLDLSPSLVQPPRLNQSYDEKILEFLRLLNQHLPRIKEGKMNKERGNLTEILDRISSGKPGVLSNTARNQIMHLYRDSNAYILKKYFPEISYNPFQYEEENLTSAVVEFPKSLTVEDSAEIAARIWVAANVR